MKKSEMADVILEHLHSTIKECTFFSEDCVYGLLYKLEQKGMLPPTLKTRNWTSENMNGGIVYHQSSVHEWEQE